MSGSRELDARADRLFVRLLELEPARRAAQLDRECAGEPELRRLVERLLAVDSDGCADPIGDVAAAIGFEAGAGASADPALAAGARVGPFEIEAEVGRGGMAVVYRAGRVEGDFRQTVALKVLSAEVGGAAVLERFRQERSILAALEHPSIARILDGGALEDGRPWLALEFVDGQPIDRHCLEHGVDLEGRLRLVIAGARAVQHAHRNLVVHRDLKPSNLLVTGDETVKLLDFGIAKVLAPERLEADQVSATRTTMRWMTPSWASPEQVRGEPVATTSDVYQIGLLLYELTSGRPAHRLRDTSWAELERVVCRTEPQRPSDAARAAAEQGAGVPGLDRFPADLERIVLKALRKEPSERYGSAGELADDLERFLADEPVRARPDSFAYRASKFVRRHRLAVAVAAAAVVFLAATTLALAIQSVRLSRERDAARREAAKAAQVGRFLSDLFEAADPSGRDGRSPEPTAGALLARGAERLERELGGEPEMLADLLGRVAAIELRIGRIEAAGRHARRALESARLGADAALIDRNTVIEAGVELARGRFEPALESLRSAHARLASREGADHETALQAQYLLAVALQQAGEHVAAERTARDLAARRRATGAAPAELSSALRVLGSIQLDLGRLAPAEAALREALRVTVSAHGTEHPTTAWARNDLAFVLERRGEFAAAAAELREALRVKRLLYDEESPSVVRSIHNLARVAAGAGELIEARALGEVALAARRRILGDRHPETLLTLYNLALVERDLDAGDAARRRLDELLASGSAVQGPRHPRTLAARVLAGHLALDGGAAGSAVADDGAAAARLAIAEGVGLRVRPAAHLLLGRLALVRGAAAAALAELDRAREAALAEASSRQSLAEIAGWRWLAETAAAGGTGAAALEDAAALVDELERSTPRLARLAAAIRGAPPTVLRPAGGPIATPLRPPG